MDFHLDRRLRLKAGDEIEHKGLYQQAVIEIDEAGRQVGRDFIPWHWTLSFHGTEVSMADRVGYETANDIGRAHPEMKRTGGSSIMVKLRPLSTREGKLWGREPTYHMFGTDRVVRDFVLRIAPAKDGDVEGCSAWASVSYSSEMDFQIVTQNDYVEFTMLLQQAAFDRYVWNIAQGLVDEVSLSVGLVDGFYSEWTPEISTEIIKVLAGSEHVIEGAEHLDLARVGKVGKAELAFVTRRPLPQPTDEYMSAQEAAEREERNEAPEGGRKSRSLWPRIRQRVGTGADCGRDVPVRRRQYEPRVACRGSSIHHP